MCWYMFVDPSIAVYFSFIEWLLSWNRLLWLFYWFVPYFVLFLTAVQWWKINFAMSNISLASRNILSKSEQVWEVSIRAHELHKIIPAYCRFYALVYVPVLFRLFFPFWPARFFYLFWSNMRFYFCSPVHFSLFQKTMNDAGTFRCSRFDGASRNDQIYRVQTAYGTWKNESKICKCNHPKPQTRVEHKTLIYACIQLTSSKKDIV